MTDRPIESLFRDLITSGVKNLSIYRDHVNELNVFPVPDGDTGSNMMLTLENGLSSIKGFEGDFPATARRFADNTVLGARGNSGVILSQFFKGFSLSLAGDPDGGRGFLKALKEGVALSYKAVADPVEGTMLTVMREAADRVEERLRAEPSAGLGELLGVFIDAARVSLENTPNLLPVLKAAGVIDSGGAGLVYIFEGMLKFMNGEEIAAPKSEGTEREFKDYSKYDTKSRFPLGYCTELLIQLSDEGEPFGREAFVEKLGEISESIVVSRQGDKVKVHAHSLRPERILSLCHVYGEFLELKIENMTVQHTETHRTVEPAPNKKTARIAAVCVANDRFMREKFFEMGADVVVNSTLGFNPSSGDFVKACELTGAEEIFVFPNCKNSVYAAEQAGELYDKARVTVIGTRSVAECYAALAIMDYDSEDPEAAAEEIRRTVAGIRTVTVSRAVKDARYGDAVIKKGDYIALFSGGLLASGGSFTEVAEDAVRRMNESEPCDVMTFFFGEGTAAPEREELLAFAEENYPLTDFDSLETETELYDLIISFE